MGETPSTTTPPGTDLPVAVYAQTSQAGRPYVEAQITGTAAITLARHVARRLHRQHLAHAVGHEALTCLIAGAITDHPVELTPDQADDLILHLQDATYGEAIFV